MIWSCCNYSVSAWEGLLQLLCLTGPSTPGPCLFLDPVWSPPCAVRVFLSVPSPFWDGFPIRVAWMDLSSSYRLLWMCSNYQPALGYQKVKHWLILRQSRATALEIISLVKQFVFFFFPPPICFSVVVFLFFLWNCNILKEVGGGMGFSLVFPS